MTIKEFIQWLEGYIFGLEESGENVDRLTSVIEKAREICAADGGPGHTPQLPNTEPFSDPLQPYKFPEFPPVTTMYGCNPAPWKYMDGAEKLAQYVQSTTLKTDEQ